MSTVPIEDPTQAVLVPHWLDAVERAELHRAVLGALDTPELHPVLAIHLGDVLTELHVATARELVWPAAILRVRRATGWAEDVVPVRLSAAEVDSVRSLPGLGAQARHALTTGRTA